MLPALFHAFACVGKHWSLAQNEGAQSFWLGPGPYLPPPMTMSLTASLCSRRGNSRFALSEVLALASELLHLALQVLRNLAQQENIGVKRRFGPYIEQMVQLLKVRGTLFAQPGTNGARSMF
jgi:hypothetical protein